MADVEVKVDSIRQAFLRRNIECPWLVILKSKSSDNYLPIHIIKTQAELIQRLLLDDEPMDLESLINSLSLPVKQMSKGILESIIIESIEENRYQAKLILKPNDKADNVIQVALPVGNAIALSFITKAPIFVDEALLVHTGKSMPH